MWLALLVLRKHGHLHCTLRPYGVHRGPRARGSVMMTRSQGRGRDPILWRRWGRPIVLPARIRASPPRAAAEEEPQAGNYEDDDDGHDDSHGNLSGQWETGAGNAV